MSPASLSPFKILGKLTGRNQNSDVLRHLLKRGSLSQYEAGNLYRVTRLAARIYELKGHGVLIMADRRVDPTGKRYVRYHLRRK